jgi:hypothetical protein
MFVLTIIVVLMARMVNQAVSAWSMGESNMNRLQNLRAVTDFIGNELQAALLPIAQTGTNSLQLVVNPTTAITSGNYNRDTIFWQTPLATDQTLGDVAEIGYFVKWDTTKPANPRSELCRFFVNPGSVTTSNSNFLIYSSPTAWLSDSIIQSVAPATMISSYQGLFAENVIGLWLQCLDPYGQPITLDGTGNTYVPSGAYKNYIDNIYDSRRGYTYTEPDNNQKIINPPCALPAGLNISLVMLDSQSANRVTVAQQQAINAILQSGTNCSSASAFVSQAFTSASLQPIRSSLRYFQTRIYLQNSK